jgi:hypothetical protein
MLSIYLIPFVKAFIFQIVNQNKKLDEFLQALGGVFYTSNGWKIKQDKAPEVNIAEKTIWLKGGDRHQDLRIHRYWNLSSNLIRDKYIAEIDSALNEFASSANRVPTVSVGIDFEPIEAPRPMARNKVSPKGVIKA